MRVDRYGNTLRRPRRRRPEEHVVMRKCVEFEGGSASAHKPPINVCIARTQWQRLRGGRRSPAKDDADLHPQSRAAADPAGQRAHRLHIHVIAVSRKMLAKLKPDPVRNQALGIATILYRYAEKEVRCPRR